MILLGDNIDVARPGDEVEIVGIYKCERENFNEKLGSPIFKTFIEGNYVKETREIIERSLTEDDKRKIKELSNQSSIF